MRRGRRSAEVPRWIKLTPPTSQSDNHLDRKSSSRSDDTSCSAPPVFPIMPCVLWLNSFSLINCKCISEGKYDELFYCEITDDFKQIFLLFSTSCFSLHLDSFCQASDAHVRLFVCFLLLWFVDLHACSGLSDASLTAPVCLPY